MKKIFKLEMLTDLNTHWPGHDFHVNMDQSLLGMFSNTLLNLCREDLKEFWREKADPVLARCT